MTLTDDDLRQLDESSLRSLTRGELLNCCLVLVDDLKESRERLNQNPANSSKPPSSRPPWAKGNPKEKDEEDESGEEDDESVTVGDTDGGGSFEDPSSSTPDPTPSPNPAKDPAKKKPGKQPGAPGHARRQEIPLTATIVHRATHCGACGHAFSEDHPFSACAGHCTIDLEVGAPGSPGLRLTHIKHLYGGTTCSCGHITSTTPHRCDPDDDWNVALSEWHLVGPTLVSLLVCLSQRLRMSRQRIREFLLSWLHLELSTGVINQCLHEAGRAAAPLMGEIIKEVRGSGQLHVDETAWLEGDKKPWLWVFTSLVATCYIIGPRTAATLASVLDPSFAGVLISDGYLIYRKFLHRLRCWAHLVRKARGLKESLSEDPQKFGGEAHRVLKKLMAAVYEAREGPCASLTEKYKEFLADFRECCQKNRDSQHDKTRDLAREFLNDWDVIFSVLANPQLPLTNNEAEQALRHWVIARRICYGTRTAQGSRVFTTLASVIDTCRKRLACPWKYFAEIVAARRRGLPAPALPAVPVAG